MSKDLDTLYRENEERIFRYALKNTRSREDAEDITEDVFLRLASYGDIFSIQNAAAWLYRVARNLILDARKKRKEQRLPDTDVVTAMNALLSDSSPETELMREAISDALEQALSEMPPEQAEAYIETELNGLPVKELSDKTGISVATLNSRKHYAVKTLRKKLAGLYRALLD